MWTDERPQTSRSGRTSPIVASTSSASRSGACSSVAASFRRRRPSGSPNTSSARPAVPNLRSRSPLASRGRDQGRSTTRLVNCHPFRHTPSIDDGGWDSYASTTSERAPTRAIDSHIDGGVGNVSAVRIL